MMVVDLNVYPDPLCALGWSWAAIAERGSATDEASTPTRRSARYSRQSTAMYEPRRTVILSRGKQVRGPEFSGLGPDHPIVDSARYDELDRDPSAGLAGCGSQAKDSAWVLCCSRRLHLRTVPHGRVLSHVGSRPGDSAPSSSGCHGWDGYADYHLRVPAMLRVRRGRRDRWGHCRSPGWRPSPAARARTIAWARSATCNLLKIFET